MFCTQDYQLCHLSFWPQDSLLPYFFPKLLQCPSTSAENFCRSYMLKENTKHIPDCSFTLWLISPPLLSYSTLSKFSNPLSAIQSLHFLTFFTRLVYPSLLTSWPRDSLHLLCFSLILPQLSWKPSPSPPLPQHSRHLLVLMFHLPFLNPPPPLCRGVKIQILFFFSFYLHSHLAINILTVILSNSKPLTFHCGIFCIPLFFTLSHGSCKSHPQNPLIILSVWTCFLHTHSQRRAMLIHLPSTFSSLLLFFNFSLPLGFNW